MFATPTLPLKKMRSVCAVATINTNIFLLLSSSSSMYLLFSKKDKHFGGQQSLGHKCWNRNLGVKTISGRKFQGVKKVLDKKCEG